MYVSIFMSYLFHCMSSHQAASYIPPLKYCCQITSGHSWVLLWLLSFSVGHTFKTWVDEGVRGWLVESWRPCHKGALAWSTPNRRHTPPKSEVSATSWKSNQITDDDSRSEFQVCIKKPNTFFYSWSESGVLNRGRDGKDKHFLTQIIFSCDLAVKGEK